MKSHILKKVAVIYLGLVLFGCSENSSLNSSGEDVIDSMCTNIDENLLSCDFKEVVCKGEVRHFKDETGDNTPYVDLTEMTMTVGEGCIGLTITVDNLPEKLKLNHNELEVNDLNYSWGVWIDLNANNYPMDGDLMISLDNYKWEESSEITTNIMEKAVASIVEMSSSSSDAIAFISSSLSGNTFSFYIPKSLHKKVLEITNTTNIQFKATFNDGKTSYRDYYPNDATTIN